METIRVVFYDRVEFIEKNLIIQWISDRLKMVNNRDKQKFCLYYVGGDYYAIRNGNMNDVYFGNLEKIFEEIKDL